MKTIDPNSEWVTHLLATAPTYRKDAVVGARPADGAPVTTVLANGHVETVRGTTVGEWIVTNPGGEEYAIPEDTFAARYEPTSVPGQYQSTGKARAAAHGFSGDVSMGVPWGTMTADCRALIVTGLDRDGDPAGAPWLVGYDEFHSTYIPDTPCATATA